MYMYVKESSRNEMQHHVLEMEQTDTVSLVSGDSEVFVLNKSELMRESDYFRGMFDSGMRECAADRIVLQSLSGASLEQLCAYVNHTGEAALTEDKFAAALQASSYLQVKGLLDVCLERAGKRLSEQNITFYSDLAKECQVLELQNLVDEYIDAHLLEFSRTEEFLESGAEDICELLQRDTLDLDGGEIEAFKAAIVWMKHDSARLVRAKQVLQCIRFSLMTKTELDSCVESLESLGIMDTPNENSAGVEDDESAALQAFLAQKLAGCVEKQRCARDVIIATGGFTGSSTTNKLQILPLDELTALDDAPPDEDWRPAGGRHEFVNKRTERMPAALCEHGACVLDNLLYLAGGQTTCCQDGRHTRNTLLRYDPRFNSWTELCPMQTPRSLFYLGALDRRLYAVAGRCTTDTATRSVEAYTPADDKWHSVAALPIGIHQHAGCTHDGGIYVSGGFEGPFQGHLDRTWRYRVASNTWEEKARMRQARSYHAMVALPDQLLVAGGVNYMGVGPSGQEAFEDVKSCEVYDPRTDQWSSVCAAPRPASCMPYVLLRDRLYLFGGHSFNKDLGHFHVQVLNTRDWRWSQASMTSHNILYFACSVLQVTKRLMRQFQGRKKKK